MISIESIIARKSLTISGREHPFRRWLLGALVFNPIVTTFFCLILIGNWDHFFVSWMRSYVISDCVSGAVIFGSYFYGELEGKVFSAFGLTRKRMGGFKLFLVSMLFVIPGLYMGFRLANWIGSDIPGWAFIPDASDYRVGLVWGVLMFLVFFVYASFYRARHAQKESEERLRTIEAENMKAQIRALTAQMNPHLLFNALNTIAATIPENPEFAEGMTVQLADLYRQALKATRQGDHSLEEELQLCRSYLAIEKARFRDRLRYEVRVGANVKAQELRIPALLLQPLVENAVKHGIGPRREGGQVNVDISEEEGTLILCISDDGVGFGQSYVSGNGTALENCRKRVQLKFGAAASMDVQTEQDKGTRIRVELPCAHEEGAKA
jgi:hypothetical protein